MPVSPCYMKACICTCLCKTFELFSITAFPVSFSFRSFTAIKQVALFISDHSIAEFAP